MSLESIFVDILFLVGSRNSCGFPKVVSEESASNSRSRLLDSTNLVEGEWSRSIADIPHRINISGIYELPFGALAVGSTTGGIWSHILGGWTISATGFYQSGFPRTFQFMFRFDW